MVSITPDTALWSTDTEKNVQMLREAGVDFSTQKREVINVCDSAC